MVRQADCVTGPKRYQVFVSSTFTDLQAERLEVTGALLKTLRCLPTGMELFPSSSRPPWDVIRPLLDVTDYMVLLLAGRYGSVDEQGISFTEHEYDYAFGTGIPVVAFERRNVASLPAAAQESDPAMLERLQRFLEKVRSRHTVQKWDDPTRLALDVVTSLYQEIDVSPRPGWVRGTTPTEASNSTPTSELPSPPAGPANAPSPSRQDVATTRTRLRRALDQLLSLAAVRPDAGFDGLPDFVRAAHAERLAAIESATVPLVQITYDGVGRDVATLDADLLAAVAELAPNLRLSGSTDLINLTRAPGVLLFHALGISADAHRRYELLGRLLSEQVEVNDPYRGDAPAASVLAPDVVYPLLWPSRRLYFYLDAVFADEGLLGPRAALASWERWTYLHAVATEYYAAASQGYRSSWPYLRVESAPNEIKLRTVVGRKLVQDITKSPAGHPLLAAGAFGGSAELFETAAMTFESNFCAWAREQDWAHLPAGGGMLLSNPHYPGDRTGVDG